MNVLRASRGLRGLNISSISRTSSNIRRLEAGRVVLRCYQHLSPNSSGTEPPKAAVDAVSKSPGKTSASATPPKPAGATQDKDDVHISIQQQRKNDWEIIKRLSRNLWPKDDWSTKARVVVGMGLLVSGKVCGLKAALVTD